MASGPTLRSVLFKRPGVLALESGLERILGHQDDSAADEEAEVEGKKKDGGAVEEKKGNTKEKSEKEDGGEIEEKTKEKKEEREENPIHEGEDPDFDSILKEIEEIVQTSSPPLQTQRSLDQPPEQNQRQRQQQYQRPKRRIFSCYSLLLFVMDLSLLILSLLYPILIKSKYQSSFVEAPLSIPSAPVTPAPLPVFARASPRRLFPRGRRTRSGDESDPVVEIVDGDLAALKTLVSRYDVVLVMYYASWDADSLESRAGFIRAASSSARRRAPGVLRFAAVNCRARNSSCHRRATGLVAFPAFYAYSRRLGAEHRGLLYDGPRSASGYLAFVERVVHPFSRLDSSEALEDARASFDTVVLGHFDVSDAGTFPYSPDPSSMPFPPPNPRSLLSTFATFHSASTHFATSRHPLSLRFFVVASPSLARELDLDLDYVRFYRASNETLTFSLMEEGEEAFNSTKTHSPATTAALIVTVRTHASRPTVIFVAKEGAALHPLLTRDANLTLVMIGPDLRESPHAYNPSYAAFRETALWFRACDDTYHDAFQHVLRSSLSRFRAQHFCCDKLKRFADELDDEDEEEKDSFSSLTKRFTNSEICFKTSTTITTTSSKNLTRVCSIGVSNHEEEPPPPTATDWRRFCRLYRGRPSLCWRPLTKNAADVVEDGVLSVPGFAGLACRLNRSVEFAYVVRDDFPVFAKRFEDAEDSSRRFTSFGFVIAALDSDEETPHLLAEGAATKDLAELVKNLTEENRAAPFRRWRRRDETDRRPVGDGDAFLLEITSDSLHRILSAPGQQLLLLFYSNTCGLCRVFNRYVSNMAKLFVGIDRLKLGRLDIDANDLPWNLTMTRVPSLILFASSSSSSSSPSSHPFPVNSPLALPKLVAFVLRHLRDAEARRRVAGRLCDAACARRNLEEVRRKSLRLQRRKTRVVDKMLRLSLRVEDLQRDQRRLVADCGGVTIKCAPALAASSRKLSAVAARSSSLGERLAEIEKTMRTMIRIEAKLAGTLIGKRRS